VHIDDQGVAIPTQLHIAEEAGFVERTQRLTQPRRIELVTDVHGKVVVDGAFRHTLQSLDADIANREAVFCL
jgi:spore maturation protein SpmA